MKLKLVLVIISSLTLTAMAKRRHKKKERNLILTKPDQTQFPSQDLSNIDTENDPSSDLSNSLLTKSSKLSIDNASSKSSIKRKHKHKKKLRKLNKKRKVKRRRRTRTERRLYQKYDPKKYLRKYDSYKNRKSALKHHHLLPQLDAAERHHHFDTGLNRHHLSNRYLKNSKLADLKKREKHLEERLEHAGLPHRPNSFKVNMKEFHQKHPHKRGRHLTKVVGDDAEEMNELHTNEHDTGGNKLESIPLLLVGDYEIIIEKK